MNLLIDLFQAIVFGVFICLMAYSIGYWGFRGVVNSHRTKPFKQSWTLIVKRDEKDPNSI